MDLGMVKRWVEKVSKEVASNHTGLENPVIGIYEERG